MKDLKGMSSKKGLYVAVGCTRTPMGLCEQEARMFTITPQDGRTLLIVQERPSSAADRAM